MINSSKKYDNRFWDRWRNSGSVEGIEAALQRPKQNTPPGYGIKKVNCEQAAQLIFEDITSNKRKLKKIQMIGLSMIRDEFYLGEELLEIAYGVPRYRYTTPQDIILKRRVYGPLGFELGSDDPWEIQSEEDLMISLGKLVKAYDLPQL